MMAHEVNNTIGPVNSILESALQTKNLWTKEHETLEHALRVAYERNGNLNIFMRNFADVVRLPLPEKKSIDLNGSLETVVTLFQYKAHDSGIELLFDKPAEPLVIDADQQQLEQALINIIKNAMEAIEANGKIVIASAPLTRRLTITDSGGGISGEHSEHLFSPFFSTKKNGQGVGLTLVKEILLNHGFPFSLKTIEANKTVFSIDFNVVAH
jgi:signal transduction histidine kinase